MHSPIALSAEGTSYGPGVVAAQETQATELAGLLPGFTPALSPTHLTFWCLRWPRCLCSELVWVSSLWHKMVKAFLKTFSFPMLAEANLTHL